MFFLTHFCFKTQYSKSQIPKSKSQIPNSKIEVHKLFYGMINNYGIPMLVLAAPAEVPCTRGT